MGGNDHGDRIQPSSSKPAKTTETSPRYTVFVGNLSFKTSKARLEEVFARGGGEKQEGQGGRQEEEEKEDGKVETPPSARLLSRRDGTPRGCAFVDLASAAALQRALLLHHSRLDGRVINVELTAGGGGKGEVREAKLKKKNARLDEERKKLHEKYHAKTSVKTSDSAESDSKAKAKAKVKGKSKSAAPSDVVPSAPEMHPDRLALTQSKPAKSPRAHLKRKRAATRG